MLQGQFAVLVRLPLVTFKIAPSILSGHAIPNISFTYIHVLFFSPLCHVNWQFEIAVIQSGSLCNLMQTPTRCFVSLCQFVLQRQVHDCVSVRVVDFSFLESRHA